MRLMIGSSAAPDRGSGIGAYAMEMSEAFVRMGMEIHYVSPAPENWDWMREHGITNVKTNMEDDPIETARHILNYAQDNKIDAIINNDNPVLQSITPGVRCPVIVIGHMDRKSIASLACWRPEWSDCIVTISYDIQKKYTTKYKVPVSKCQVIHNGVKDRGHDGNFDRRDANVLRVLYAGGSSKNKGCNRILSALKRKKQFFQNIEFEWYGDISDRYERHIKRFKNVHFHGRVSRNDFLKNLRKMDVILLPSKFEGCPMAMLEAMSFGVVPIASDGSGAMRWLISSGYEGFICNLRHWTNQMTDCLMFLRDHPKALSQMKEANRNRYLEKFQTSLVAERLLKLITNPTVKRDTPLKQFTIARWHRPLRKDGKKAPLIDRFCIRLGIIRKAGILKITN